MSQPIDFNGILVDEALYSSIPADHQAAWISRQDWLGKARPNQIMPEDHDWLIAFIRAGRGFGKTLSLCEYLWWEMQRLPNMIGHVIAPTLSDVNGTLFEGQSGLLSCIPNECLYGHSVSLAYNKTKHYLMMGNGSLIRGFSATEEAGRLRGPQCHTLIGDEVREWNKPAGNAERAFDNAMFGLRLPYPDGTPSRAVLGTTPIAIPFLKRLEKRPGVRLIRGTSYENMPNLAASFKNTLFAKSGTAIGRQEIEAEYIDEESDQSIYKRSWFQLWPTDKPFPSFMFILESYDTGLSEDTFDAKAQTTDPTACVVLGVFNIADSFTEQERRRMQCRGRYGAIVLECWAERLGFPDLLEKARLQHRIKWGARESPKRSDLVLIEDKVSGRSLRQVLVKYGIPTWPYNPGKANKVTRGHAASPIVAQRLIFVPESARPDRKGMPRDWIEPFLEEVCAYAGEGSTEHDDQFDALTQAVNYLKDRAILEITPLVKFLDPEEEKEAKMREAERHYGEIQAEKRANPYG